MSKPGHVLSFATDKDASQLFIHADGVGLDVLIKSLTRLRTKLNDGSCDHDHLATDAWAGDELSEKSLTEGVHPIHHVKIYAWTPEWAQKHGLVS
jgi:hypothetical protein